MRTRRSFLLLALVVIGSACAGASDDDGDAGSDSAAVTSTVPPTTESAPEGPAPDPVELVEGELVTPDGRTRTYRAHVPAAAADGDPVPLLLAFHGGGGSSVQYERASGFAALAETDGVLVVFPEGTGVGRQGNPLRTWNGGQCCGPAVTDAVDDVAYVRQLVDELDAAYDVDRTRVLAAGHSNGAAISYRLACEASDLVVAIGVQAAPLGVDPCTPVRPVSVLHIHGSEDRNVPIDGGVGPEGISGVDFRPVREGLATFAAADGCDLDPTSETTGDDPRLVVDTWEACDAGSVVRLIVVEGAGHGWMSTDGGGGPGEADDVGFSSTETIWDFLSPWAAP